MGERAIVVDRAGTAALYLHWMGFRCDVESALAAYRAAGNPPIGRGDPGCFARLAQTCCNMEGPSLGVGLGTYGSYVPDGLKRASDHCGLDHGVYVVDGYSIYARHYPYTDYEEEASSYYGMPDVHVDRPVWVESGEGRTMLVARKSDACVVVPDAVDVAALCAYCSERNLRAPDTDDYGWARLCQVACNATDGKVCFGSVEDMEATFGDLERVDVSGWEPREGCRSAQTLVAVDEAQPPSQRLGEEYLLSPTVRACDLKVGDTVYLGPGELFDDKRTATVEGFGDGRTVNGRDVEGLPFVRLYESKHLAAEDNINNYLTERTYRLAGISVEHDNRIPDRDGVER